jgi:hypothetical protein
MLVLISRQDAKNRQEEARSWRTLASLAAKSFLLVVLLVPIGCLAPRADEKAAVLWTRTELYFGRSIPADAGGGEVSDADWERFLAEVVAPRFPDGLTIVDAVGQYRDPAVANGGVAKEETKVLLIFHPRNPTLDESIDEVRQEYLKRFRQKSVLKVTSPAAVRF